MKLDLDANEINTALTLREKIALYLLLLMVTLILRPKYSHQWEELTKTIRGAMKMGK